MQNDQCMKSKYRKSDSKHASVLHSSRGTLMLYNDRSAQRCFKLNAPIDCLKHRHSSESSIYRVTGVTAAPAPSRAEWHCLMNESLTYTIRTSELCCYNERICVGAEFSQQAHTEQKKLIW